MRHCPGNGSPGLSDAARVSPPNEASHPMFTDHNFSGDHLNIYSAPTPHIASVTQSRQFPMLLDYLHFSSKTLATAPTRAPILLCIGFALHLLAVLCVGARVLVKWKLGRLGREDVLIVISTVSYPTVSLILSSITSLTAGNLRL